MGSTEGIESPTTQSGTLTFLFADLRDYTAFVERNGDAAAAELIADYRRIVRAELAKTGGGEIKTEGDSFYLVFPSARLALQCALGILQAADRAATARPDRPIQVGLGIHAGEPVPHEGQYVGSAVNIASRLAGAARENELLVSDIVRGLVRTAGAPPMQERIGLVLKGVDDAPRIYSVLWRRPIPEQTRGTQPAAGLEMTAEANPPVLCPELIGRDNELARLDGRLREAVAGHGRTLLVAGEAGFGKSALLRSFSDRARNTGVLVLTGECTEIEGRRPFAPFVELLRSALRELQGVERDSALGKRGADLLARFSEGSSNDRGGDLGAESERYRIHGAFTSFFADLGSIRPSVIAIEDLHWADEGSLELFQYLARKVRDRAMLLVATYRSDELHRLHPLRQVLAALGRARLAEEVALRSLTRDQSARFLRVTLNLDREPTAGFLSLMHERCDGSPFFMEEVLRSLVQRGDMALREGSWRQTKDVSEIVVPESIRAAVQERLRALDAEGLRVLEAAAVMGKRFEFEILRATTGVSEPDLVRHLRRAVDAQLAIEEPAEDHEERYTFRHALTREAVLADLLHRERRLLHRQVGEAIEAAGGDPARAEELAYHFDEAGDRVRALRYHDLAAREAERLYASARAQQHLERAIELAPAGPELAALHLRLAQTLAACGEYEQATRAAAEGRRVAAAAQARETEIRCVLDLARLHFNAGDLAQADALTREAMQLAESLADPATLADAYDEASRLAFLEGHYDEGAALGDRALAVARASGNVHAEADVLNTQGAILSWRGDIGTGHRLLRESLTIGHRTRDLWVIFRGYTNLLYTSFENVSAKACREILTEYRTWQAKLGVPDDTLAFWDAWLALGEGDWDRIELIGQDLGEGIFWAQTRLLLALVRTARSGPTTTSELVGQARRTLEGAGHFQRIALAAGLARVAVVSGDSAALLAAIDAAPTDPVQVGFSESCLVALALWAARQARDEVARERSFNRLDDSRIRVAAAVAAAAFVDAERAVEAGELSRSAQLFLESASLFERWLAPVEATLARLRGADQLLAVGDRHGAARVFRDCLVFWERVGASWYLERLNEWGRERGFSG